MSEPSSPTFNRVDKARSIRAMSGGLLVFAFPGEMQKGVMDVGCTVTSFELNWDADKGDSQFVLCGDEIPGARSHSYKIKAKLFVSLAKELFLAKTWEHKGKEIQFIFSPGDKSEQEIRGKVIVDPIDFGGDVRKNVLIDFTWDGVGEPKLINPGDYS